MLKIDGIELSLHWNRQMKHSKHAQTRTFPWEIHAMLSKEKHRSQTARTHKHTHTHADNSQFLASFH